MNAFAMDDTLTKIEKLTQDITAAPKSVTLYQQRAKLYSSLQQGYLNRPAPFTIAPDEHEKRRACRSTIAYLKHAIHDYNMVMQLTSTAKSDIGSEEYRPMFEAYMLCGALCRNLHEYTQALTLTHEAITFFPRHDKAQMYYSGFCATLGACYLELENYPEAIKYLTVAIEHSQHASSYYAQRAECQYGLQQYQLALQDFQTSAELDDVGWNTSDILPRIDACYAAIFEQQSRTLEVQHKQEQVRIRHEEREKIVATLSASLQQLNTSDATPPHYIAEETVMTPQGQEVFHVDLESLKSQIHDVPSSPRLKEASVDLIDEIIRIDQVGNIDPAAAIGKARKVTEIMIHDLYLRHINKHGKNLVSMITALHEKSILPDKIFTYLETVRKLGNLSVHYSPNKVTEMTRYDVKVIGIITASIVQWYITSAV